MRSRPSRVEPAPSLKRTALIILAAFALATASCAELKRATKDIGHGTRDAAKAIGHGARDVAREVSKAVKK
jgi:hypothetical protein